MNVRVYFKVTQLHQLEVDTENWPYAPQDDPDELADWLESRAGYSAQQDLLGRIDGRLSWVDTEDEVEITECVVAGSAADQ